MIDNKKNELRDYLFTILQTMNVSEKEMEELSAYTKDLLEIFEPIFKINSSNKSKDAFAKALSKFAEENNVKRNA